MFKTSFNFLLLFRLRHDCKNHTNQEQIIHSTCIDQKVMEVHIYQENTISTWGSDCYTIIFFNSVPWLCNSNFIWLSLMQSL